MTTQWVGGVGSPGDAFSQGIAHPPSSFVPLIGSLCCSHTGHPPHSSPTHPDVLHSQFKCLSQTGFCDQHASYSRPWEVCLFPGHSAVSTVVAQGFIYLLITWICHSQTLASKNTGLLLDFTFWYQGRCLAQSRESLHKRKREGVGEGKERRIREHLGGDF